MIKVECVAVKFYFGRGLGALIYPRSLALFCQQVAGSKTSLKLAYALSAKFKRVFAALWRPNSSIASLSNYRSAYNPRPWPPLSRVDVIRLIVVAARFGLNL